MTRATRPSALMDVPSGLDAETGRLAENAVDADHVVTFHDTKPGLPDLDVPVTVADIGIPDTAELFIERGDLTRLERDPASHKGDSARCSRRWRPDTGAPALTAQAALRSGADLVRVACPEVVAREIQPTARTSSCVRSTATTSRRTTSTASPSSRRTTYLILAPGLGNADATLDAVADLRPDLRGRPSSTLTPCRGPGHRNGRGPRLHARPRRTARMGGETTADWRERAKPGVLRSGGRPATAVKGPYDIVSNGERTRVGRTGNPGMTVGGTGDVLAGVTGALASVQDPLDAAASAADTVGTDGDRVVDDRGHGLVATDLLDEIPSVLWQRDAEP